MYELPTDYQKYIHKSLYARWDEEKGRRETWAETVKRYFDFFEKHVKEKCGYSLKKEERTLLETSVLKLEALGSMRALMTAGKALERDHMAGYNCTAVYINRIRAFDEILYCLICGSGTGFSVERQYVQQLPDVAEEFHKTDTTIVVDDSKIGWAKSLRELVSLLYAGQIPKWDLSKVRPAGARLKIFGGRASGPGPLDTLFKFSVNLFTGAAGRKLTSLECHDLVCSIADAIVSGGVRRSALLSLSNLSDDRMRHAKSGAWSQITPYRRLANNSVCYTEKPDNIGIFMQEWLSLYESKSGERGVFNRQACKKAINRANDYRLKHNFEIIRDPNHDWIVNPCSEILLRDRQCCNLSVVMIREEDTLKTLKEKVKVASILGTIQSSLTDFRYLSKKWKDNCEEERLLGVSLTGIMDNKLTNGSGNLDELQRLLLELKEVAIKTNIEWANKLKINPSTAITSIKPSGNTSQLVDSASGIHTRFSEYYIRTVRCSKTDPLSKFMIDKGVYHEEEQYKNTNWVFSFPHKSPKNSLKVKDLTALQQLEIWLIYQKYWCEHKPSCTIYVKEDEWMEVGAWVYKNFDEISGVSFLPHQDNIYVQAPYQEISEEDYNEWVKKSPDNINWGDLVVYEKEDNTVGSQELSCTAGNCEI